jgi:glycosyltransferase involved in cell wall biosynthesis
MFYGHRSPQTFLEGLRRALERGWLSRDDTEVVFMGHGSGSHAPDGLPQEVFRAVEHRPYRESLRLLHEAAVLLLVVPAEGGAGNHTGKLFPYLASGRPILLQAPEPNVAADLVRESGSGVVVPPHDPDLVAAALRDLHDAWRGGRDLPHRRQEVIARYEANRQVRDLARLLDGVVAGRGGTGPGLPSRDASPMVSVGGAAPPSP